MPLVRRPFLVRAAALLLAACATLSAATAPMADITAPGLRFGADTLFYEVNTSDLRVGRTYSFEVWLTPDADCPAGAMIIDAYAPGSLLGSRLRMAEGGRVEFLTNAPFVCVSPEPLPTDRPTHVVGVFDYREKVAALYIDGKRVSSFTPTKDKVMAPTETIPLRIGADQNGGNRFHGVIHSASVYRRVLTEQEVASAHAGDPDVGFDERSGHWEFKPDAGILIPGPRSRGNLVAPPSITGAADGPPGDLNLWYRQPAREFVEALPFGNGRFGGMVFGGVERDRIQLNDDTIWSGAPYDPANPAAPAAIREARELIFAGKREEAEAVLTKSALGLPSRMVQYQTLGSVMLDFDDEADREVYDYRRSLDLDSAVVTTTFRRNGAVTYTREVFSSAPDQVVVIRLTADQPGKISFAASWDTPHPDAVVAAENGLLTLSGKGGDFNDKPGAIRFKALLRAVNEGGTVTVNNDKLVVTGADSVTLLVSSGTNFVNYADTSADPAARAARDLAGVSGKPYAELRARHVADHRALFRRVSLDLGRNANASLPTDERIKNFTGANDPALPALQFQYGRYLLIACSRPGSQPANLAGMWNDALTAAWGGKYTININTEMNYWPAETTNLSECAEPLFSLVRDISVTGARTAQVMYEARGWVTHHNTDLWRATAPVDSAGTGVWPVGGAWLSTHLWEHYLFTGDQKFLVEHYPILKGAAEFFLDTLVPEPKHGWLVTNPSHSPEHEGTVAGPTMDLGIVRDVFTQAAAAAEALGRDADFRREVLATREKLAPYQIGKYGQLQEWLEDRDREKNAHRHSSHLYPLFPSAQITPDTPALFAAAKKSLEGRGLQSTGWGMAWKVNLWARALDGEKAHQLLVLLLTPPKGGSQGGGAYPNLFDAHPPFQIDGNFGTTSGIAEMLLQSHREGFIDLLPALPKAWPTGSVKGLRARGGFEVDIAWRDGALTSATVRATHAGKVALRHGSVYRAIVLKAGESITWDGRP